jgi:hypothetical protein
MTCLSTPATSTRIRPNATQTNGPQSIASTVRRPRLMGGRVTSLTYVWPPAGSRRWARQFDPIMPAISRRAELARLDVISIGAIGRRGYEFILSSVSQAAQAWSRAIPRGTTVNAFCSGRFRSSLPFADSPPLSREGQATFCAAARIRYSFIRGRDIRLDRTKYRQHDGASGR